MKRAHMKTRHTTRLFFAALLVLAASCRAEEGLAHREWNIGGTTREALLHIPTSTNALPVLFAFHGHGGNMSQAARSYDYHSLWPEALIVYPQGLKTPGRLTDPDGKRNGWQKDIGDQADRDLIFFDTMLESLKKDYKIDTRRIYSAGHSNGGGFTYLLWAARGNILAAVAPSAAVLSPQLTLQLKPKPVFHVAGENDPLVKFAWQKLMIEAVLKINQCDVGTPWDTHCTLYASKIKTPVIIFIHNGTHTFPKEAPGLIVKFFKQQSL